MARANKKVFYRVSELAKYNHSYLLFCPDLNFGMLLAEDYTDTTHTDFSAYPSPSRISGKRLQFFYGPEELRNIKREYRRGNLREMKLPEKEIKDLLELGKEYCELTDRLDEALFEGIIQQLRG